MITRLTCACGTVHIDVEKAPIITTECHCASCRKAGERMAALPGGRDPRQPNGGTRFVLYRKDRARIEAGRSMLRAVRLTPDATTRRVVAACCNTPLFLEFKGGHWLSLYAGLWPVDSVPPTEIRTMTTGQDAALDGSVRSGARATAAFYARLLVAWVAMGFRSPEITVNGELHA
ncbi:MAG: hypothetical protein KF723_10660 [Rhizobiaceae bacterium]|nr:hypothetical protein [Rhizobiaceae bacterium]